MPEEKGAQMAPVFYRSPMPVLLSEPTPDPRHDGAETVRVIPGLIRLGSGPYEDREVVWINETGGDVTFSFEASGAGQFFDLTSHAPGPIHVKKGEKFRLKLAKYPPLNRIYPYTVHCAATKGRPAEGDSSPQVSCP